MMIIMRKEKEKKRKIKKDKNKIYLIFKRGSYFI